MDRRNFLKTASTLLAAAALPGQPADAETQPVHGRTVLPMNRGWRFSPHKIDGAEAMTFDDRHFERVVIPHTNLQLPWHNFDDKGYQFVSTYRRRFQYPASARGKRLFVDFEGAMTAINEAMSEYSTAVAPDVSPRKRRKAIFNFGSRNSTQRPAPVRFVR